MSLFDSLYPMVRKTMLREGTVGVLTQPASGATATYDPATGVLTQPVATVTNVRCILLDFAILSSGKNANYGTLIESGDKQCYMDAKSDLGVDLVTPLSAAGDMLVVQGVTYRIANIKEYNPSGTKTIMYDLWLKR